MQPHTERQPAWLTLSLLALCCVMAVILRARPAASNPSPPPIVSQTVVPPPSQAASNVVELAFVIDTTGSMGGLIDAAKQKVWSIVNDVMRSGSQPQVRVGIVAYRDHGDEYVTKLFPITEDLDAVYASLMSLRASGGGDEPEDVRRALSDAVHGLNWSKQRQGLARMVFLVGDAEPHDDYVQEPSCRDSAQDATRAGIVINTIECGSSPRTRVAWQDIAQHGAGQFFQIQHEGGVVAISTPYDAEMTKLGARIDGTYVAYGGSATKGGAASFQAARNNEHAAFASKMMREPSSAAADRTFNKAINGRAYDSDLVGDVSAGRVRLDSVRREDLPVSMQSMKADQVKQEVSTRLQERKHLQTQVVELSRKRDAFLSQARKGQAGSTGFDAVVLQAIKKQAAKTGLKL